MKRLIIIVEGYTEEEFVNSVLVPYLNKFGIYAIDCFKIKHSKGGLSKYEHLKKDLLNCVNESNSVVTTFVDYYALPRDFPNYQIAHSTFTNKQQILVNIENGIKSDISNSLSREVDNLIPYIQLHEFEALVFACSEGLKKFYKPSKINSEELTKTLRDYPNPEDINNSPNTAPSKRLKRIAKGYDKVIDGVNIISEIGIEIILEKCPRFKSWTEKIISEFIK